MSRQNWPCNNDRYEPVSNICLTYDENSVSSALIFFQSEINLTESFRGVVENLNFLSAMMPLMFAGRKDFFPHQTDICQPLSVRALEIIVQSQRDVLCRPGGQVLQMHSEARADPVHPIRSEQRSTHQYSWASFKWTIRSIALSHLFGRPGGKRSSATVFRYNISNISNSVYTTFNTKWTSEF